MREMENRTLRYKAVTSIMLLVLSASLVTIAFNIEAVRASGTIYIYIKADGSIDPPSAPIQRDGNIYTLTDNIYDSMITIRRNNIVVDGASYTVQGAGIGGGIDLIGRNNVTLKNVEVTNFEVGIALVSSDNNTVSGSTVSNNIGGIYLDDSSDNNTLSGNTASNNGYGFILWRSSDNNTLSGNTASNNIIAGISLGPSPLESSTDNTLFHNNLIDNAVPAEVPDGSVNIWDDGYPSGGNYWSDYSTRYPEAQELDGSGIWDTPYVIGASNQDNFPLMDPWTPPPPIPTTIPELKTEIERCWSEGEIDNQGIANSLVRKLNLAQKLVDKGKIAEAKSILEDDFIPQVQNLSGICIAVEAADILIQSADYILSNL